MNHQLRALLPPSLAQIKSRRTPVLDANATHEERLSALERLAITINDRVGTPGFFFIIISWTVLWLGWNLLAPSGLKFDPPTSFVLWLFMSNCLQIFLMPLIMVAQNLQDRHTQLRAESAYQVNLQSEQEIEFLFRHLEYQNAMLTVLARKLDVSPEEVKTVMVDQAQEDAKAEQH